MLKKNYRLVKEKDFKQVFKRGKYLNSSYLSLKIGKNKLPLSQFGFVVSTKISKKAVVRNKIKRQLKKIIQLNLKKIDQGLNMVIITHPSIRGVKYQAIETTLIDLLKKAKVYD